MTASDEKMAALEKKMEQLKAQKQKLLAQATGLKRKQDTQKKILLGAAVITLMEQGQLDKHRTLSMCYNVLSDKDAKRLADAFGETLAQPQPEPERWVGSR